MLVVHWGIEVMLLLSIPEEVAGNPLQNALMLYKLANRSSKPKETERYRLGVLSAEIAQWIEHFATDEVVVGSSPTFGIFHNIKIEVLARDGDFFHSGFSCFRHYDCHQ